MADPTQYRLVAYFPNRRACEGTEEKYIIDLKSHKTDLCGYHDLSSCRFVIEKLRNSGFVPNEIISRSKKYAEEAKEQYAQERVLEELENLYITINLKFDEILETSFIGNPVLKALQFTKNKIQERIKELKEVNK
jgi:hypothetical protein